MPASYKSRLRRVIFAHRQIAVEALRAAAIAVRKQAKMNARGGFKSGDFVTGRGVNSIDSAVDEDELIAEVGSTMKHMAYWQMGHHNVFTGQYERERWLSDAFMQTRSRRQQLMAQKAANQTALKFGSSRVNPFF